MKLICANGADVANRIKSLYNSYSKRRYSEDFNENLSVLEQQLKESIKRIVDKSVLLNN